MRNREIYIAHGRFRRYSFGMINENNVVVSRVEQIATLIEEDIRRRRLLPGAAYLTAVEVGTELGINERKACRAMALLAEKGVLVRKRRAGTFVGTGAIQRSSAAQARISILLGSAVSLRERSLVGTVVDALLAEIPTHHITIDSLPEHGDGAGVERVLKPSGEDSMVVGMLLLGCSLEQHLAVYRSQLAAVVLGSVYQSVAGLSSVDIDNFESGHVACRYLLDRGHRKILLLCSDVWLPGDNFRLDGVNAALAETAIKGGALVVRSVNGNKEAVASEVSAVLRGDDRPTGMIFNHSNISLADTVVDAILSLGLRIPEDISVVSSMRPVDCTSSQLSGIPYTYTEEAIRKTVMIAVRMLKQLVCEEASWTKHITVPVELVEPQAG